MAGWADDPDNAEVARGQAIIKEYLTVVSEIFGIGSSDFKAVPIAADEYMSAIVLIEAYPDLRVFRNFVEKFREELVDILIVPALLEFSPAVNYEEWLRDDAQPLTAQIFESELEILISLFRYSVTESVEDYAQANVIFLPPRWRDEAEDTFHATIVDAYKTAHPAVTSMPPRTSGGNLPSALSPP